MLPFRLRTFLHGLFCILVLFSVSGCCGDVILPEKLSKTCQDALWTISITRHGEGLFEGLVACGSSSGTGDEAGLSCSLIDSTGITLMKLDERQREFRVVMALPPFDEAQVSDYLTNELSLVLAVALARCDECGAGFLCTIEDYPCAEKNSGISTCIRGVTGPFDVWKMRIDRDMEGESSGTAHVREVTLIRPWSGMQLRLTEIP